MTVSSSQTMNGEFCPHLTLPWVSYPFLFLLPKRISPDFDFVLRIGFLITKPSRCLKLLLHVKELGLPLQHQPPSFLPFLVRYLPSRPRETSCLQRAQPLCFVRTLQSIIQPQFPQEHQRCTWNNHTTASLSRVYHICTHSIMFCSHPWGQILLKRTTTKTATRKDYNILRL